MAFFLLFVLLIMFSSFKRDGQIVTLKNVSKFLITHILVISFAIFMVVPSFKHGIYLFSENEQNVISDVGTINNITNTYGNNKFTYEDKHSTLSSYVYIDGERYYIMYIGDFNVGDEVEFEYLPKSKVILSIYHAEETQ
jgi:hypothetical protein